MMVRFHYVQLDNEQLIEEVLKFNIGAQRWLLHELIVWHFVPLDE